MLPSITAQPTLVSWFRESTAAATQSRMIFRFYLV